MSCGLNAQTSSITPKPTARESSEALRKVSSASSSSPRPIDWATKIEPPIAVIWKSTAVIWTRRATTIWAASGSTPN